MKKEKKEKHFRKRPQYPGGQQAMKNFIRKELKYPQEALDAKIEGSVMVQFTVDQLGEVAHAKIISGIGYGCDEEALRVVQALQFEANKNRGYQSKTTQSIGIHFRLPKKQRDESGITIEYSIRPAEKSEKDRKDSSSDSYEYTIEW